MQHGVQVFPSRLQIAPRRRSHIVTPLLAVLGESELTADALGVVRLLHGFLTTRAAGGDM
jgi:hypothetical protein